MSDNNLENKESQSFIVLNALSPTGPAEKLFIAGASVFEITVFIPPIQRFTILGINLPDPDTFGPYDSYMATLTIPGTEDPLSTLYLIPSGDNQNWVASGFLDFGGTIPNIEVEVRPYGFDRIGEVVLQGPVFP